MDMNILKYMAFIKAVFAVYYASGKALPKVKERSCTE